jgi:hypothetical protein
MMRLRSGRSLRCMARRSRVIGSIILVRVLILKEKEESGGRDKNSRVLRGFRRALKTELDGWRME